MARRCGRGWFLRRVRSAVKTAMYGDQSIETVSRAELGRLHLRRLEDSVRVALLVGYAPRFRALEHR